MLIMGLIVFLLVTTLLNIYTKGRLFRLQKIKLQFVSGGILLFIGKENRFPNPRPLSKKISMLMLANIFIGMFLFYTVFAPEIIRFIRMFIGYVVGTIDFTPQPVVIPVPLLFKFTELVPYLLIAIAIAVTVHELLHAVIALREGVTVKSWGVGIVLLIPIAFVELDENSFNASSTKTKLNIISAGVFGNALVTAFLLLTLAFINIATPYILGTPTQAVSIVAVDCSICNTTSCPAKVANIEEGTIIRSVNNIRVNTLDILLGILSNTSIGSKLVLHLCNYDNMCKDVDVTLSAHKKDDVNTPCFGAKFGMVMVFEKDSKIYRAPWFEKLMMLLNTMFVINLSLFVLNSVPLFITDGALFLKYISSKSTLASKIVSIKVIDIVNAVIIILAIVFSSYILLTR